MIFIMSVKDKLGIRVKLSYRSQGSQHVLEHRDPLLLALNNVLFLARLLKP